MQGISRRSFLKLSSLLGGIVIPDLPFEENIVGDAVELIYADSDITGILEAKGMPTYLLPLHDDYFYDFNRDIIELNLGGNIQLGFKGKYSFRIGDKTLRASILHNVTGEKVLPIAVTDEGFDAFVYFPIRAYSSVVNEETILGEYTMMSEFYPNKIFNLLLESKDLSEFQDKEQGFHPGTEYSLIDILQLSNGSRFLPGKTSSGSIVRGGGVCAGASILAKASLLTGASFVEKWMHPWTSQYWVGPANPEITLENSDATVEVNASLDKRFDFIWTMPKDYDTYYLKISAQVFPNGHPIIVDGLGNPGDADARLVLTYAWTTEKPEHQVEKLEEIIEAYDSYRKTREVPILLRQSRIVRNFEFGEVPEKDKIFYIIYPDSRTDRFSEEFQNNEYISTVKTLADLINQYGQQTTKEQFNSGEAQGIGDYLKTTEWYESLEQKTGYLERGLRFANYNTFRAEGEAIQCVGWVVLLAHLGYEESPKNVGGFPGNAADIIPISIRNGSRERLSENGIYYFHSQSIDDVEAGDLFISYETRVGHVGAVVGKKEYDNETVLLIAEANRRRQGEVNIFEVDKSNYEVILGAKRIVIGR